ncbi:copper chaperone PCu(A)C [Vibrio cincinnatiensis]|uniref:copper chaperone PCu(A)C n=1 Tax=Vibrio cincinnatiensis TaxID=675 RepID=UPI001EDF0DBA|nr:copper chaperone PCu(A)C [Vibrio cincinnatiensis]MCG3758351.1 copper chaperone PCu(A)C [Vibrio cincinnatiensis]MCG3761648.1 copper chaperone PCu(A)C [Vibrio cincinnatiensis]
MKYRLFILITSLFATYTYAHDSLVIKEPYARATPPNAPTSAVFGTLINHSQTDEYIVAASSPSAGKIELHDMIQEGEVMKMRQVDQFTVPAQGTLELKPGSFHIMLFDLQHPFDEGEEITMQLMTQTGQSLLFIAPVKKIIASMPHHHH